MEQEDAQIHTDMIQLDQFIKWLGITGTGGQVKILLEESRILVNGKEIHEKIKKL